MADKRLYDRLFYHLVARASGYDVSQRTADRATSKIETQKGMEWLDTRLVITLSGDDMRRHPFHIRFLCDDGIWPRDHSIGIRLLGTGSDVQAADVSSGRLISNVVVVQARVNEPAPRATTPRDRLRSR